MKQQRLCYISRDYYNQTSAGNKAKTDTEETLVEMGAINLGLHRTIKNSKIFAFFRNLAGIIRACILLKKEIFFSCNIPSRNILHLSVLLQDLKVQKRSRSSTILVL